MADSVFDCCMLCFSACHHTALRRVARLLSQAMSIGPHVDKVHSQNPCLVPNGAGIDVDNVDRICHMSCLLSPVYQMVKWRKFFKPHILRFEALFCSGHCRRMSPFVYPCTIIYVDCKKCNQILGSRLQKFFIFISDIWAKFF